MSWDDDDGDVLTASQEASLILAEQAALHARAGARSGLAAAARPPPAPAMTTSPLKIAPQAAAAQPVAAADAGQQGACAAAAAAPPAVRRRKLPAALLPNATVPAAAAAAAPAGDEDLPPARFEGGLRYVFTAVEVDWLCRELLQSGTLVVGFDIGQEQLLGACAR